MGGPLDHNKRSTGDNDGPLTRGRIVALGVVTPFAPPTVIGALPVEFSGNSTGVGIDGVSITER